MSCREATRLISEGMNRPLRRRERVALRWHLLVCTACRRYRLQLLLISNALRWMADRVEVAVEEGQGLTAEARQRIGQAIRGRT